MVFLSWPSVQCGNTYTSSTISRPMRTQQLLQVQRKHHRGIALRQWSTQMRSHHRPAQISAAPGAKRTPGLHLHTIHIKSWFRPQVWFIERRLCLETRRQHYRKKINCPWNEPCCSCSAAALNSATFEFSHVIPNTCKCSIHACFWQIQGLCKTSIRSICSTFYK